MSESQLTANRQNAQASTGPRTEESKKRTRLNGLRHGLTGQTVVMPYEDREAYDGFCAREMIAAFEPANEAERELATSIANDSWRLSRARAMEENIYALEFEAANPQSDVEAALTHANTWLTRGKEIHLLSLYAGRITRAIDKAKRELKELQNERKRAQEAALEEAIILTRHAKSKGEIFNPEENGFGFSTHEIDRIITRRKSLAEAIAYSKSLKKAA